MTASGPLATPDDLAARIGTLTTSQAARAAALLGDASALVRAYCNQDLSLVEEDLVNLSTRGGRITLPMEPVVAVTQIATVDGSMIIPEWAWIWNGLDRVTLDPTGAWSRPMQTASYFLPTSSYLLDPSWTWPETMQVTYSHGYAAGEMPATIVMVVCNMVGRTLTAPSITDGLSAETIGKYSYQAAGGSSGVGVRLTADDEKALEPWKKKRTSTIQVHSW